VDITEIDQAAPHSFIRKRIAEMSQSFISSCFSGFHQDSSTSCKTWSPDAQFSDACSPTPSSGNFLKAKNSIEYSGSFTYGPCGVEATLEFHYEDRKTPMRSFSLALMLRLSESTDIVGTAVSCLQSLTSSMKLVADAAVGELTQLPPQDISHSHSASCFSIKDLCCYDTQFWRPDPLCCKPDGCSTSCVPSELSCKFPEQVILIHIESHVSAFECRNLHSIADAPARNPVGHWPRLKLGVGFVPHLTCPKNACKGGLQLR
jgi:hypothetical protein